MKPYRQFGRWFQLRWKEALGNPVCPYLYRWTLVLFGFSIRLHHWIKSDDRRAFHDHACDLVSIILRGSYTNVTPTGRYEAKALRPRFMRAEEQHYLDIPPAGAWTLLLCGRPRQKWGFYVRHGKTGEFVKWRPLRYFHKYGIIQNESYQ